MALWAQAWPCNAVDMARGIRDDKVSEISNAVSNHAQSKRGDVAGE
jgi:hypothetical protein